MSPNLEKGDDNHIRGFILSKLYLYGMWGRISTGKHNKYMSVRNLRKGYDPKYHQKFPDIIKKMKSRAEELIMVFPSTGDQHICANIEKFNRGLELCNQFRVSIDLPPLDRQLKEIMD